MATAENVIGPVNLAVILNWPPRFEIRADNRRFPLSPLSRNRFCVTGPLTQSRSRETGALSASLAKFRSPRIPQGINVEDHVLEIMGESGIRAENGRLLPPNWETLSLQVVRKYRHRIVVISILRQPRVSGRGRIKWTKCHDPSLHAVSA